MSGDTVNASYSFSVSLSQSHYRVYINNTSKVSYNVSVGGNSFTVKVNSLVRKIYPARSILNRYIDITSQEGPPLKCIILVIVASK